MAVNVIVEEVCVP